MNEAKLSAVRRMLMTWGVSRKREEKLKAEIKWCREQIDAARDVHVKPMTDMPRGTDLSDPTQRAAELAGRADAKIIKRMEALNRRLMREMRDNDMLAAIIDALDEQHGRVIVARYIEYRGHGEWQAVADALHMSKSSVHRLEREAVEIIAAQIDI